MNFQIILKNTKKEYLCNELLFFSVPSKKMEQMFDFRKKTNNEYINKNKKNLINYHPQHNIWREVEEYWFDYHSNIIQSKENINNLKTILTDEEDKKNPLKWLNNYITFLKNNSTITEKKNFFLIKRGIFNF